MRNLLKAIADLKKSIRAKGTGAAYLARRFRAKGTGAAYLARNFREKGTNIAEFDINRFRKADSSKAAYDINRKRLRSFIALLARSALYAFLITASIVLGVVGIAALYYYAI